jgi:uncharacterized protein YndB with AHSA1/START domain
MIRTEKSIVIAVPVAEVFAYAADPQHLPEYFTGVLKVSDIRRLPNGGFAAKMENKFAGVYTEMSGETTEFVPNERLVTKSTGKLADVTITVTFQPVEGTKTKVTCLEEYTFHGGVFGKVGEPFLTKYVNHAAEMTQETLKARVEAGIPTGAPR